MILPGIIASSVAGGTYVFTATTGALTSNVYRSVSVTIGPNTPLGTAISIANGTYSKSYDFFTASSGTVNPGDIISLQATSSASSSTDVVVSVTIGGAISTWTITTAALLLDRIPNAVAAWDTANQLIASFVGTPMTQSVGVVTGLNDQIGSRNWTMSGSPAVGTGTIGNSAFMKFDGVNDKGTYTSLTLPGDFTWVLSGGSIDINGMGSTFGNSAGQDGLRGAGSGFDLRGGGQGPTAYNITYGWPKGFHCVVVRRSGTATDIWVDGEFRTTHSSITNTITLNQFGVSSASTTWSAMGFGRGIIFNRAITDAEIAIATADTLGAFPNTICIDATLGSDSNLGWNDQVPLQNITAVRTLLVRRGIGIYLKRGEVWGRTNLLTFTTTSQGGAPGFPVLVGAYGNPASPPPKINGAELAAGPWTNTVGTEYSATVTGLSGTACVWSEQIGVPEVIPLRPGVNYTSADKVTILVPGTAGTLAANTYAVTGTLLTVNVGADPTGTYNIQVAHLGGISSGGGDAIHPAAPDMTFSDIDVQYAPADGAGYEGANPSMVRCRFLWCANDGQGDQCVNFYEEECTVIRSGDTVRRSSGAPGDAGSTHGGTTGLSLRPTFIEASKAGSDHVDDTVVLTRGFYIRGCNRNIFTANPDAGVTGGLKTFEWGTIIRTSVDGASACENSSNQNMVLNHVTFINTGSAPGTVAVNQNSTGTLTMTNCLSSGFGTRLIKNGSGTLTADYNLANIGSIYGAGASAGPHDLTADPVFVDAPSGNYALVPASPGTGAANDGGDIGAF